MSTLICATLGCNSHMHYRRFGAGAGR